MPDLSRLYFSHEHGNAQVPKEAPFCNNFVVITRSLPALTLSKKKSECFQGDWSILKKYSMLEWANLSPVHKSLHILNRPVWDFKFYIIQSAKGSHSMPAILNCFKFSIRYFEFWLIENSLMHIYYSLLRRISFYSELSPGGASSEQVMPLRNF